MYELITLGSDYDLGLEGLLVSDILSSNVKSKRVQNVNGDIRYWDLENEYGCIRLFRDFVQKELESRVSLISPKIVVMVNVIQSGVTENGSGGGWHVDSVRRQLKFFKYLEPCTSKDQGPLTYLSCGISLFDKAVIYLNRLFGMKSRFSSRSIGLLKAIGWKEYSFLENTSKVLVGDTSYIHRGLPIISGRRILMTAYIFDQSIPPSISRWVDLDAR